MATCFFDELGKGLHHLHCPYYFRAEQLADMSGFTLAEGVQLKSPLSARGVDSFNLPESPGFII